MVTTTSDIQSENIQHYEPKKLNTTQITLDYNQFSQEFSDAQYALGLLQGSQSRLENPKLLISPLTAKEAKESSGIEGTVTTVSDVFLFEAGGEPEYKDTQQVANYRNAMTFALAELKEGKPINKQLMLTMHQILLRNVRHKGTLGQLRDEVVYIANKETDPIEKATYIPMKPIKVPEYIDNLLEYIQNGKDNALIKAGIFHYQFEAIHPFSDGNGRMGRLLIPLLLYRENKLSHPILYISGYLERNRNYYIDALHSADTGGTYENWLRFYLRAVSEQLKETQQLIDSIYSLHDEVVGKFVKSKSPFVHSFINHLFDSPFTTIPMARSSIKASTRSTVASLIKEFINKDILIETPSKFGRAKLYAFKKLLLTLG